MMFAGSDVFPWRAALATFVVAAAALAVAVAIALGSELRADVAPAGERLAADARATATALRPADPLGTRDALARAGASARLLDPAGEVVAQLGPAGPWTRAGAGPAERVALTGADWRLARGAVQASATTGYGHRVVLRRPLGAGAGQGRLEPPGLAIIASGLALAALAALAVGLLARRGARRLRRLTTAAEAVAGGRVPSLAPDAEPRGWRSLAAAVAAAGRRTADLQAAVDERFDALGAGLGPLPIPAAARTPAGARVRNDALERLVGRLGLADADTLEGAVAEGLAGAGATSRRLTLSDGHVHDVDAWPVPGGRLVTLSERTEQARLAAVRHRVTGAAARHLHAPVAEIQGLASELFGDGPAGAVPSAQRILAAADRMEGTVAALLRGTSFDTRPSSARREPMGVSGLLWGVAREWDERLRALGVRFELQVDTDVTAVPTDAVLVEEILNELVGNAAKFTPRGGTISVGAARRGDGGVRIGVRDSGEGIAHDEVQHVTDPFVRGRSAAALPGAGLGLGVASALAERLGGRLSVAPGPGGDATLELPGPVAADAAPPGAPPEERRLAGAPA